MASLIRRTHSRNGLRAFRYPALVLFLALAVTGPAPAQITLDWTAPGIDWNQHLDMGNPGIVSQLFVGDPMTLPSLCDPMTNCIAIRITVETTTTGSTFVAGTTFAPYEDGNFANCAEAPLYFFGLGCDLGVVFDPDANQGASPIIITMEFLDPMDGTTPKPVENLSFEISDIDWDPGPPPSGNNFRRDQVVVTSDAGDPILMGCPVTCTIAGNTATAIIGQSTAQSGDGTVIADFGLMTNVSTVTVTYNEASGEPNPAIRGIGLFFNVSMAKIPVELQSLSVD
jgi:hypothetical protein